MTNKAACCPLAVFFVVRDYVYSAINCSSSENQSILKRRPCHTIDGAAKLLLENQVLPVCVLVFAPHFDFLIVAAGGNYRFKLGMRPGYLPGGPLMSLESLNFILGPISSDRTELEQAITVARYELCAVIVKLRVYYI